MSGTTEAPSEPQVGDDLDAVIGAAWDTLSVEPEAPTAQAAPSEPVAEPTSPTRDESGRFATKPEPAAEAAPKTDEMTVAEPPSGYAIDKDTWAGLPHAVRDTILARESAVAQEKETGSRLSTEYEPVRAVLDQHKPMLAALGLDGATAVGNLLRAQAALQEKPAETLAHLARQYGVDLSRLIPRQAPQGHQDPTVRELQDKLARLEAEQQRGQQAVQQSAAERGRAEIDAFKADKPFFDEVRPIMAGLMQAGQAQGLQQAYDMACHAHPTVRGKIAEDSRRAEAAKQQKTADEARKRGSSVTPSRAVAGAPARAPVPDSIEDHLSVAWDSLSSATH